MFRKILAISFALALVMTPNAFADSHQGISHIHNLRVFGNEILLGTHEGLYKYIDAKTHKKIGKDSPDLMGLSVVGKRIFAGGHPAAGSSLPNPVGLIMSTDKGQSWKTISLQGKVDFHFLEVTNSEIYGADSGSGELLYSADLGKNWKSLGKNTFSDIAINPQVKGSALAIREGKLYSSTNSLKSIKESKLNVMLTSLEWNNKRLLAASGKRLLSSIDSGKSWTTLNTFSAPIGAISQSDTLIVAIVGNAILKSSDNGKKFTS